MEGKENDCWKMDGGMKKKKSKTGKAVWKPVNCSANKNDTKAEKKILYVTNILFTPQQNSLCFAP